MISLNRIKITGKLDELTPICVVKEILKSYGINHTNNFDDINYYLSSIEQINSHEEITIPSKGFSESDIFKMIRFINSECTWGIKELQEAVNFLLPFTVPGANDSLPNITKFIPGEQEPGRIRSLNACVLFKACKCLGIKVNRFTNIEHMFYLIELYHKSTSVSLSQDIYNFLQTSSKLDMINFISFSQRHLKHSGQKQKLEIKREDLERVGSKYTTKGYIPFVVPSSEAEAVYLAGSIYSVNISKSDSPLDEYKNLSGDVYIPKDPRLKEIYGFNKNLLNLKKTFDPLFPKSCYSSLSLAQLVKNEGIIKGRQSGDDYDILREHSLFINFHEGIQEETKGIKTTTVSYDSVKDLEKGEILSYGLRGGTMQIITLDEIKGFFESKGNFIDMFTKEFLSDLCIRKLEMICVSSPEFSSEVNKKKLSLLETIKRIKGNNKENNYQVKRFIVRYNESNSEEKKKIIESLNSLLNVSMYMRGWEGIPFPFPISEVPYKDIKAIEIKVSIGIVDYEKKCELMSEKRLIDDLPLFKHKNGKYEISTAMDQGKTIGERLRIIKSGYDTSNANSCIRMSSNWLASSAYRLMVSLGMTAPFDINSLLHIT